MNLQRQLSIVSLAIAAGLPFALPSATAQMSAVASASASDISITSLSVEQLRRLQPGNVLAFSLSGTPGSTVSLQITGATQTLQMNEVQPGEYVGEYTIRSRDRLTADSRVSASLLKNGRTTSTMLNRSLLLGANDPAALPTAAISAFTVTAVEGYEPGDELKFSLTGKPGGAARVALQGVNKRIALAEVSRGVYEGGYVLRRQDRLNNDLIADGFLLSDKRETSQRLQRQIERSGDVNGSQRDARQQPVAACASCGVIESVNVVEVKSDSPNVIGTIAGGLLGGVVGNQVGGGSGKDLATVIGAVGGAYAGNRIENSQGKTRVYRVKVKLEGGSTQSFDYANDPAMQVGSRVKVENGALIRR